MLPYEENDSAEEQFTRRMGMRKYFNQLSMNLVRIRNTKLALSKKNHEEKVIQEEEGEDEQEAPQLVET